jgi:Zn finger protein HypA/HybF involved in hydrogenase expression
MVSNADYQAAAAAKDADTLPEEVIKGTKLGHCPNCDQRFEYPQNNLDPCPNCGSEKWVSWGVRLNGEDIPNEEINQ